MALAYDANPDDHTFDTIWDNSHPEEEDLSSEDEGVRDYTPQLKADAINRLINVEMTVFAIFAPTIVPFSP